MEQDMLREQALVQLVNEHQRMLLRLCYVYLRDEELARDAVQETFLKAYRGWTAFRGESSQKTWLTRIAVNVCRDMQRTGWFRHTDRRVTPEDLPMAAPAAEEDQGIMLEVMALPPRLKAAREKLRDVLERGGVMDESRMKKRIQRVFDTGLSGLKEDPDLASRVLAQGREGMQRSRKLPVGLAVALQCCC